MGKVVKEWSKDTTKGIETTITARIKDSKGKITETPVAYLYSFKFDERVQKGEQYCIGTSGVAGRPIGIKNIAGELRAYSVEKTLILSLLEGAGIKLNRDPMLKDLNELGGIDLISSVIDKKNNKIYKQYVFGVFFDEVTGAVGLDVLQQEEAINFTARDVQGFREVIL